MEATQKPRHIEALEDEFNAYMDEHYGPMWSMDNQAVSDQMTARLMAEYDFHGVDEWERMF